MEHQSFLLLQLNVFGRQKRKENGVLCTVGRYDIIGFLQTLIKPLM